MPLWQWLVEGGFEKSEFNRATQAMRQVGSTFKPIVYSAAIETTDFTVATLVQDAPLRYDDLSYKTLEEKKVWKPGNYGNDYKGDITLRRALQLSRNVCTIRVLEDLELDVVFEQAGPRLGIGFDTPSCSESTFP